MKRGWETKALEDVCQFTNGLWKGEKHPLVRIGVIRNTNFTKDGTLDDSDIAYVDVESKKLEKRRLQFGDILLEKSGGGPRQPVGRVVLFDKKNGEFSFSNFTAALRVLDSRELDFHFLHKFLHWTYISGITEGLQSHSTGIRNLDGDAYKAIRVSFPTLSEQRRIVGVLDKAFAGLATAQANAERNLRNARALFESQLQSVFTRCGEGWVEKKLADLSLEIFAGGDVPMDNHSKTPTEKYQIPIYTNGEKNDGLYGYAETARVTSPSITISARGTIGHVAIRNESYFPAIRLIVVVPDKKIVDLAFLYYAIKGMVIGHSGTSIPQLTVPMARDFPISMPSLTTQRQIAGQLEALSVETCRLESIYKQKLTALAALKKSLLHQAFTGAL